MATNPIRYKSKLGDGAGLRIGGGDYCGGSCMAVRATNVVALPSAICDADFRLKMFCKGYIFVSARKWYRIVEVKRCVD